MCAQPDSSYGSLRASLVSENLSSDKEQLSSSSGLLDDKDDDRHLDNNVKSSSSSSSCSSKNSCASQSLIRTVPIDELSSAVSASPPSHVIVKNLSESETLIFPTTVVDYSNNSNNNNFYQDYQHSPDEVANNWAYDLSYRTASTAAKRPAIDTFLNYQTPSTPNSDIQPPPINYRNLYPSSIYTASAMKGNVMTLSQYNDYLSPPSSVSSSSGYEQFSDSNNNSSPFITTIEQAMLPFHSSADLYDELNKSDEYCFLVEDINSGCYTTLTNATVSANSNDLLHLHQQDYASRPSYYGNNHSTSSGESRSPDDYHTEEYDTSFTQLTSVTATPRANGMYSASPSHHGIGDHSSAILTYDQMSPAR